MSSDPIITSEAAAAAVARLSAQLEGIGREIGQMRKDVAGDLARVDERLDRLTEQVTTTNGSVRRHELELQEIKIRADERARTQTEALHRADRRWTRIAWSVGLSVTVMLAVTGWALAIAGHI